MHFLMHLYTHMHSRGVGSKLRAMRCSPLPRWGECFGVL